MALDQRVIWQQWMNFAEAPVKEDDIAEGFRRWQQFSREFPFIDTGYVRSAILCLAMKNYSQAEEICRQGLKTLPESPDMWKLLAKIAEAKGNTHFASQVHELIKFFTDAEAFGKGAEAFKKVSQDWIAQHRKYASANLEEFENTLRLWMLLDPENKTIFMNYARLPLKDDPFPHVDTCKEVINRMMQVHEHFAFSLQDYAIIGRVYNYLLDQKFDSVTAYCFNMLMEDVLERNRLGKAPALYGKIAILIRKLLDINFLIPILKYIPPMLAEIIVQNPNKMDAAIARHYGIQNYTIRYSIKDYGVYSAALVDHPYYTLDSYNFPASTRIICYIHFLDVVFGGYAGHMMDTSKIDLLILPYANAGLQLDTIQCKYFSERNIEALESIPKERKCEMAVTGPFKFGSWLQRRKLPHAELRQQLESVIKRKLPTDRPLVAVFEDGPEQLGHIVHTLNALADVCTIIFHPLHVTKIPAYANNARRQHLLARLKKNILVWDDPAWLPNILRFAADIVINEFYCNTFTENVFFGLPCVIPFFKRISFSNGKFVRYDPRNSVTPEYPLDDSAMNRVIHIFCKERRVFDILDAQSIKAAITGTEYRTWYQNNLPELQAFFGKHMMEEAPQKTAEYIMRFAYEGTLGKDCAAIALKKKF